MRETSRDYGNPFRPWPVAAFNAVGRAVPLLGAGLGLEALAAAARRAEGLQDFGEPDPLPILARLLESIESEADLTPMGRWITRIRLIDLLRVRLRLEAHWAAHPEILEQPLLPVVAVVGLQRTGTTLLHRLLSAAPEARSVRSWEALNPVPYRTGADPDGRITHAERAARGLSWLSPDFFAVHPVDPLAPEEEVVLLDLTLMSTVSEATLRVPSWSQWLEQQDQRPAYRYLRKVLLTLQAADLTRHTHWVLKTPHHMEWLSTFLRVFPGTRVVMTHRDPVHTLPSFCSMVAHGRGLSSDGVDPEAIGVEWLQKCQRMVIRAWADRAKSDPKRFLDVDYDELLADPVGQAGKIHRFAHLEWDGDVRTAIAVERGRRPQHLYGRHVYDAVDFGLSPQAIAAAFKVYRDRRGWEPII